MSARVSLPRTLDPPPAKRARLHESSSSRRRKSSPDLLDATNSPSHSHSHSRPLHISSPSLAPSSAPSPHAKGVSGAQSRRISTRRPLVSSNTTTSQISPATSRHSDRRRILRNETPVNTLPSFYLHQERESPDPLDTISPSVSRRISPAGRSSALSFSAAAAPSSSARRSRRPAPPPAPDAIPTQEESPAAAQKSVRSTRLAAAQPATESPPNASESRRSLRSNDTGSRARSELAAYFPNYEELLSLEPPKTEFLAGSTTIKLIDDLPVPPLAQTTSNLELDLERPFKNPLVNLNNCEVISLPEPSSPSPPSDPEDPLDESIFFRAHRRNERQEKQLRNIERDRAQHEKQHLDRLLDELQGHDWLRIMGISSHTEQDKKLYEPKRDYFIREISAVLQKFKIWKEEEKRRKLDKDKAADLVHSDAKETTALTTTSATADDDDGMTAPSEAGAGAGHPGATGNAQRYSGDPPDPNDVDAWAARQLLQEARSATTTTMTGPTGKRPKTTLTAPKRTTITAYFKPKADSSTKTSPPPPPLDPEKPFTSFFTDPDAREAALSANRKGHRTPYAFGHRIPDLQVHDFELPPDILTPEAIDSCRRQRRRMKRASRGSNDL
ncbi:acetyltransferase SAS4-like domain-containing protein [Aspergillus saccharolyticus JOP 1030-1]|uniref:Something about silencing protein 4 domain-containing protein n=1 Tax=Aspergillus saccharolyticus JOP 1030-1 TaxID=1450539 RepID=A0A318ZUI8_9EURO|nr:hypothetical protein BP01DRAFT_380223 [Aspergillus saccharolyticus JOP 1030-1]PYH47660.1 hypothetical protein BP01DRAFT_380223 [Aspergillus saccharolyticus JOP 1030-1]